MSQPTQAEQGRMDSFLQNITGLGLPPIQLIKWIHKEWDTIKVMPPKETAHLLVSFMQEFK